MRKGYTTHKIEALADLKATLKGVDKPVVLLEGRRKVAKQDSHCLAN
jgi:hypothetical protein